jgi:hypothetical protein
VSNTSDQKVLALIIVLRRKEFGTTGSSIDGGRSAWWPQPRLTHASKGVRQTCPLQPGTFAIHSVKIALAKMQAHRLQDFNAAQHISGRGCRR